MSKILYVEDNEDNVCLLTSRLQRVGHSVLVAWDGREGIDMAQVELPDLIIMDLGLPVMDGWEATRRLKEALETKAIPVIALSAHVMQGDRERAMAAGADDFDSKPVNFRRLLEKMGALLGAGANS